MNTSWSKSSLVLLASAFAIVIGISSGALAQFGGLDIGNKLKRKVPNLLGGDAPISTGLSDAKWGDESKDGFTPSESPSELTTLPRTANGGFVLQPGYYTMDVQSYCLMAGTHGPGAGDGYLYAPVKGAAADAVVSIVRQSVRQSDIEQEDSQADLLEVVFRA